MSIGWIIIHRELMDKPIWKGSTPEQKVVLMTLLMMVDFKPSEWEWNGEKYSTKPGEKITSLQSIVAIAGKGISIQNVRSSLKRFEKLEFLTNQPTRQGRLISIINWDSYQATQHSTQHSTQQRPNKGPTPNEQGNKETIEQNTLFDEPEPPPKNAKQKYDDDYQTFYDEYPKKTGKGQGQTTWRKLNVSGKLLGLERMLEVLRGFEHDNWQETDKKYIPNLSTWLNDGSFMDQHKSDSQRERDKAKSIINWDAIAKIKAGGS